MARIVKSPTFRGPAWKEACDDSEIVSMSPSTGAGLTRWSAGASDLRTIGQVRQGHCWSRKRPGGKFTLRGRTADSGSDVVPWCSTGLQRARRRSKGGWLTGFDLLSAMTRNPLDDVPRHLLLPPVITGSGLDDAATSQITDVESSKQVDASSRPSGRSTACRCCSCDAIEPPSATRPGHPPDTETGDVVVRGPEPIRRQRPTAARPARWPGSVWTGPGARNRATFRPVARSNT